MIENRRLSDHIRVILTYVIIVMAGLICLYPLWNTVCISLSSSHAITANEVTVVPVGFRVDAYEKLLDNTQFWTSFMTSVKKTLLGWAVNITLIVLMAYPLSKSEKEFRGRNVYMGMLIFAMEFSAGIVPMYLLVRQLKLMNTIWALILPGAVPIYSVIMVKNFFVGVPKSLEEAAMLDGASPMQIMLRVMLPCSKPVLATVSLFSIVGHWNAYFNGLIYITKPKLQPLMSYIQNISVNLLEMAESGASLEELEAVAQFSSTALECAKIVVAAIPLLMIYPLLQKYLITGITIGAVKE